MDGTLFASFGADSPLSSIDLTVFFCLRCKAMNPYFIANTKSASPWCDSDAPMLIDGHPIPFCEFPSPILIITSFATATMLACAVCTASFKLCCPILHCCKQNTTLPQSRIVLQTLGSIHLDDPLIQVCLC